MVMIKCKKGRGKLNYYVFICLDGVPILETILDKLYVAIEEKEEIDWFQTKYIVLDFKSNYSKKQKPIEKGKITYNGKILTSQISYFRIDIFKSQEILKKHPKNISKINYQLITFANVLFISQPKEFLDYIKKKKILCQKDIKNLEKALISQTKEQEILDTWKNIKTT